MRAELSESTSSIVFYGELDTHSGSIPSLSCAAPRLRRELVLLALLHDLVIVSPFSLVEHGLTLPVFESLSALVRASRIGTSCDERGETPPQQLSMLLQFGAERRLRSTPTLGRSSMEWERDAIERVRSRWDAILPERWSAYRSATQQRSARLENVLRWLRGGGEVGPRMQIALERSVQSMLDADAWPSHEKMLASLGRLRGAVHPDEISRAAFALQSAFFRFGALGHEQGESRCFVYPGTFARRLRARSIAAGLRPPFSWRSERHRVEARARSLGLDLNALVSLSSTSLLSVLEHPGWTFVRQRLLDDEQESLDEFTRARLSESGCIGNALQNFVGSHAPPLRMCDGPTKRAQVVSYAPRRSWQMLAHAGLGGLSATDKCTFVSSALPFDWSTRTLGSGSDSVRLTPTMSALLLALKAAGDAGLRTSQMLNLLRESDRFEAGDAGTSGVIDARSLRDRLDVLKHAFNNRAAGLGLMIAVTRGRWHLTPPRRVHVTRSPWTGVSQCVASADLLSGLSPKQRRLVALLSERFPGEATLDVIVHELGYSDDERGGKAAAALVSRARMRLAHNSCWTIASDACGSYWLERHERSGGHEPATSLAGVTEGSSI